MEKSNMEKSNMYRFVIYNNFYETPQIVTNIFAHIPDLKNEVCIYNALSHLKRHNILNKKTPLGVKSLIFPNRYENTLYVQYITTGSYTNEHFVAPPPMSNKGGAQEAFIMNLHNQDTIVRNTNRGAFFSLKDNPVIYTVGEFIPYEQDDEYPVVIKHKFDGFGNRFGKLMTENEYEYFLSSTVSRQ
jgi:hypothetical protein